MYGMYKLIEIIGPPGSGKTFISSELGKLKNNEQQIFFHSASSKYSEVKKNLSFFEKFFIKLKVISIIFSFYLIFYKRLFFKKIYKRKFFFRSILIFYRNLISIELLKKTLKNDKYLITEPGLIMHFLQDYFYTNEEITDRDIKTFNKFFLNTDNIIYLNCNFNLLNERLRLRKRGLPQRMENLNQDEIDKTICKSVNVIDNYVSLSANLKTKIIKIDTSSDVNISINKIQDILSKN